MALSKALYDNLDVQLFGVIDENGRGRSAQRSVEFLQKVRKTYPRRESQGKVAAKIVITVFFVTSLILPGLTSKLTAADNPFDQKMPRAFAQTTAYDWYEIGEFSIASKQVKLNHAIADDLDAECQRICDLLLAVRAGNEVVTAFQKQCATIKSLPSKQDYDNWSEDEKKTWLNLLRSTELAQALDNEANKTPESDYFFWLGMDAFGLSWSLNYALEHESFPKIIEEVHNLTLQFWIFGNDSRYAKVFEELTSEMQAAINFAISVNSKTADDLTIDDVKKLIDVGNSIRNAAKSRSLVK